MNIVIAINFSPYQTLMYIVSLSPYTWCFWAFFFLLPDRKGQQTTVWWPLDSTYGGRRRGHFNAAITYTTQPCSLCDNKPRAHKAYTRLLVWKQQLYFQCCWTFCLLLQFMNCDEWFGVFEESSVATKNVSSPSSAQEVVTESAIWHEWSSHWSVGVCAACRCDWFWAISCHAVC